MFPSFLPINVVKKSMFILLYVVRVFRRTQPHAHVLQTAHSSTEIKVGASLAERGGVRFFFFELFFPPLLSEVAGVWWADAIRLALVLHAQATRT